MSGKTQKQLEAQGLQLLATPESRKGMLNIETLSANEEVMTILSWENRKKHYEQSRAKLSLIYDFADGGTLDQKQFDTIVHTLMSMPQVQRAIKKQELAGDREIQHLLAQYKQSPTYGEGIGYLILEKALNPEGILRQLQSNDFQNALSTYQKQNPETYREVYYTIESSTRNLTRNYVREYLSTSRTPDTVTWLELEKSVLSDTRLSHQQKRTLITNFYDSIYAQTQWSPTQYVEKSKLRTRETVLANKPNQEVEDYYVERSVSAILADQASTLRNADQTPITLIELPTFRSDVPVEFFASNTAEAVAQFTIGDENLSAVQRQNFLGTTLDALDTESQAEVAQHLVDIDIQYAQDIETIQQQRIVAGKEPYTFSLIEPDTSMPVVFLSDLDMVDISVGDAGYLADGTPAIVMEDLDGNRLLDVE